MNKKISCNTCFFHVAQDSVSNMGGASLNTISTDDEDGDIWKMSDAVLEDEGDYLSKLTSISSFIKCLMPYYIHTQQKLVQEHYIVRIQLRYHKMNQEHVDGICLCTLLEIWLWHTFDIPFTI